MNSSTEEFEELKKYYKDFLLSCTVPPSPAGRADQVAAADRHVHEVGTQTGRQRVSHRAGNVASRDNRRGKKGGNPPNPPSENENWLKDLVNPILCKPTLETLPNDVKYMIIKELKEKDIKSLFKGSNEYNKLRSEFTQFRQDPKNQVTVLEKISIKTNKSLTEFIKKFVYTIYYALKISHTRTKSDSDDSEYDDSEYESEDDHKDMSFKSDSDKHEDEHEDKHEAEHEAEHEDVAEYNYLEIKTSIPLMPGKSFEINFRKSDYTLQYNNNGQVIAGCRGSYDFATTKTETEYTKFEIDTTKIIINFMILIFSLEDWSYFVMNIPLSKITYNQLSKHTEGTLNKDYKSHILGVKLYFTENENKVFFAPKSLINEHNLQTKDIIPNMVVVNSIISRRGNHRAEEEAVNNAVVVVPAAAAAEDAEEILREYRPQKFIPINTNNMEVLLSNYHISHIRYLLNFIDYYKDTFVTYYNNAGIKDKKIDETTSLENKAYFIINKMISDLISNKKMEIKDIKDIKDIIAELRKLINSLQGGGLNRVFSPTKKRIMIGKSNKVIYRKGNKGKTDYVKWRGNYISVKKLLKSKAS